MTDLLTPEQHAEAVDLVRALSSEAGDVDRVTAVIDRYAHKAGPEAALTHCLAALILTYGECMRAPVPLDTGRPVHVAIPRKETP